MVAKALTGMAEEWGLTTARIHLIIRDNAINMVNAAKKANIDSLGCFCHILHLVVTHSVFKQDGVKLLTDRLVLQISFI